MVVDHGGVLDRHEGLAGAEQSGLDGDPFGAARDVVDEHVLGVTDLLALGVVHGVVYDGGDLLLGDHVHPPGAVAHGATSQGIRV
ncbi:hypothetical protein GGE06_004924 [Streptomyces sp. SFB5A]|uniref:Uncharacterized protein n=1 Tax=Streptomyces nymphaeiformis TaxID=2663842 RepID=A0A7W7U2R9_9ACTN|nr:hypothetical protein [Streptomyces nymphaeiformis]